MPNFLSNKVGPLPTWGWAAAGIGVVVFVKWRQNKSASAASTNTLPVQSLNPDYGPTGWPGQGSIAGPPPISAVSQVAQTNSQSGGGTSTGTAAPSGGVNLGATRVLLPSGQPGFQQPRVV